MGLTPAERLLQEMGVTEPDEIDLEAVAYRVGAHVRYRLLDGCEACIMGFRDKAIITVTTNASLKRKRFSIAHELGHWQYHRGRSLVCRLEDYLPQSALSPERVANSYAADLLMPRYLFAPLALQISKLTLQAVAKISDTFRTSKTATAIRFIEYNHSPALVVCHSQSGRKWFTRARTVPEKWFPRDNLDPASFAFGILFGNNQDDPIPRRIGADAWFDRWEAERYEIREQTMRTAPNETLTLLLITDEAMLVE